jgi:hypothetical protein
MSALNKIPVLKRRIIKTYQKTVYGRRQPDWDRVPEALRDTARRNEYLAANPYPVEQIVREFKATPFVTPQTKTVTMGSCFAQELDKWLTKHHYNILRNVWGAVFSPQSFAQIIAYSFETASWTPDELFWVMDGKYRNPYVKGGTGEPAYLGETEADARLALQAHYEQSRDILSQAEAAVWTLGLTESWRNKRDHKTYFALPFTQVYNPELHEFHNLSYEDVIRHLDYAITTYKKYNPALQFILSVSPVPLHVSFREHLGPYVATQYSKSVLHAAAMRMVEQYDYVSYMPSFEITRSNPTVNYQADGRHVNEACVETIMDAFKQLYVLE